MYCSHCNTLQIIDAYTSKGTLWSFQLVSQNDKNIHIFSLAAVYQLLESCEHWKLLHALKIFKELPIKIDFKFFGFKLQKGFSGTISHILSTHIDHALMRKCHMWDASHIAHLQFRGKLDVMSIMIITRTHFYLTPAWRTENTTRLIKTSKGRLRDCNMNN